MSTIKTEGFQPDHMPRITALAACAAKFLNLIAAEQERPDCQGQRELALAKTKVEEAVFWASQGVIK
jgi:hypothetical protein